MRKTVCRAKKDAYNQIKAAKKPKRKSGLGGTRTHNQCLKRALLTRLYKGKD